MIGMTQFAFNHIQKAYWYGGAVIFNTTNDIVIGGFVEELLMNMEAKVELSLRL